MRAVNNRLQKFRPDGHLLAIWGDRRGGSDSPLRYASGVAVDLDGNAYVGDWSRSQIWKVACH